ncbi:MAG: HD domain-containing protein [Desulfobacterales bacterium]|nr:HD domain-containing protein [Desulfobacterales bacterium]
MLKNRHFEQQIKFILEIEKLKTIFRQSYIMDTDRHENDAEHSWHLAMAACILFEYSNEAVDQLRTLKMLLIHDLVEIYAGDTFCYDDKENKNKLEREKSSADKIFSLLPNNQKNKIRDLWNEFEEAYSPEAKFANTIDRLVAFLLNYFSGGRIWKENSISKQQVLKRMAPVENGSEILWDYVNQLIDDAVSSGMLKK